MEKEEQNYRCMAKLIIDFGTRVVRLVFNKHVPQDELEKKLFNKDEFKKILNKDQIATLFTDIEPPITSNKFDITLMVRLLNYWELVTDPLKTDLKYIKERRNNLAHEPQIKMENKHFDKHFNKLRDLLLEIANTIDGGKPLVREIEEYEFFNMSTAERIDNFRKETERLLREIYEKVTETKELDLGSVENKKHTSDVEKDGEADAIPQGHENVDHEGHNDIFFFHVDGDEAGASQFYRDYIANSGLKVFIWGQRQPRTFFHSLDDALENSTCTFVYVTKLLCDNSVSKTAAYMALHAALNHPEKQKLFIPIFAEDKLENVPCFLSIFGYKANNMNKYAIKRLNILFHTIIEKRPIKKVKSEEEKLNSISGDGHHQTPTTDSNIESRPTYSVFLLCATVLLPLLLGIFSIIRK